MKHLANDWLAGEKEKEGRRKEMYYWEGEENILLEFIISL